MKVLISNTQTSTAEIPSMPVALAQIFAFLSTPASPYPVWRHRRSSSSVHC